MNEMALVNRLMKKHKTNNPFELCDALGFMVLEVPLTGVRGFYQYYRKNNLVYIDVGLLEQVKRFVCAHELGHALMHKDTNAIYLDTRTFLKTSIYEKQANQFAINLLFPQDEFFAEYKECTISQTSQCLNVSEELLEYRLKEIKSWTQQQ
jgi:Zn-dependent peptidase ImmA (M78 family)